MHNLGRAFRRLSLASSTRSPYCYSFPSPSIAVRCLHLTLPRRAADMETVNTSDRLAHLRDLMKQNSVDIYSTPTDRDTS